MRTICRFNLQVLVMAGVAILAVGGAAQADFTFGLVKNLGPVVNSPAPDCCPNLSADGLTLYLSSGRPGGFGDYDIWCSTRPSVDAEWGPPVNVGEPVNSIYYDAYPSISADGLTLYFSEHWDWNPEVGARLAEGSTDPWNTSIWMSTRATPYDPWGPVVSAGTPPNSEGSELGCTVSGDDLTLVFGSACPGSLGYCDLWQCSRSTPQEPWGPAVNPGPAVNSPGLESGACLSADGLAMLFESCRDNDVPFVWDLWVTVRSGPAEPWGPAARLDTSINTSASDMNPALSLDGRTLFFASDRDGGHGAFDLYQTSIVPVVDFNADGRVDLADLQRLLESWGTADPAVDIGPMPWGDGTVDIKDLKVLVDHWTSDASDPNDLM